MGMMKTTTKNVDADADRENPRRSGRGPRGRRAADNSSDAAPARSCGGERRALERDGDGGGPDPGATPLPRRARAARRGDEELLLVPREAVEDAVAEGPEVELQLCTGEISRVRLVDAAAASALVRWAQKARDKDELHGSDDGDDGLQKEVIGDDSGPGPRPRHKAGMSARHRGGSASGSGSNSSGKGAQTRGIAAARFYGLGSSAAAAAAAPEFQQEQGADGRVTKRRRGADCYCQQQQVQQAQQAQWHEKELQTAAASTRSCRDPNSTQSTAPFARKFARQAQAFAFADSLPPEAALREGQGWARPAVLALENGVGGTRAFMVAGRRDFVKWYLDTNPLKRHVYEIIREGTPCKAYFDLEFPIGRNPDVCGDKLVDVVIAATAAAMLELFGIELRRRDFVELDSTSSTKFSRHLVVSADSANGGPFFADNRACGRFVNAIFAAARKDLLVFDKDGQISPFIDLGVYTRNRCFRLYLSSKYAKRTVLLPCEGRNTFPLDDASRQGVAAFLEASMVCSRRAPAGQLDPRVHLLRSHVALDAAAVPSRRQNGQQQQQHREQQRLGHIHGHVHGSGHHGGEQLGPSPFPEVEAFVLQHATAALGPRASSRRAETRAWTLGARELRFNLRRTRFCQRVRREHRSNNVFFTIDLEAATFSQGCYDPDCARAGFRTDPLALPSSVAQALRSRRCDALQQQQQQQKEQQEEQQKGQKHELEEKDSTKS
ncbi:DNA-directed primase/polymerase protein [Hondaea fermentalgiana]|uniref:DNA-directed primase/polymerase protein n=1 Tax=Hondaea fermentalgiana TaxID=2315210 RepID=A0A2R5G0G7_9STRA|nr:DNA-directed primase/polymerase protein [Hondaea fermentalgiana]|eukprot:GBG24490.1 DNA-directed primase/polymerase protein [Hondaea fermentalgiana]